MSGAYRFRLSVNLSLHTFVRSFIGSSFHHKINVFALNLIRQYNLKALLMEFVNFWHDGRYTRDVRNELLISIWRLQISS